MSSRTQPDAPAVPADLGLIEDDDVSDASEGTATQQRYVIEWGSGGRLDAVIAALSESSPERLTRSRLSILVDAGAVSVDGKRCDKPSHKLKGGEVVVVDVPAPAPTTLIPEDLPLTFVYDDDDLCIIDKPAGLVVHPGAGHPQGTVANALLFRFPGLTIGGERRPGIVHRLDKDTSGLLIVAKNDDALRALAAQFQARTVDKRYVACCLGAPGDVGAEVTYLTGHRRHDGDRRRFTTRVKAPGEDRVGAVRVAHTIVTTRAVTDGLAVVDVRLLTGRTHQIRAHLADAGHPLAQDALYGGGTMERRLVDSPVKEAVKQLKRQALHAARVTFAHPKTGAAITAEAAPPPDLALVIAAVVGA